MRLGLRLCDVCEKYTNRSKKSSNFYPDIRIFLRPKNPEISFVHEVFNNLYYTLCCGHPYRGDRPERPKASEL